LQHEGRRPFKDAARYYLRALELEPDNRVILDHLVTPWLVHKEYEALVSALSAVATSHPEVLRLQLVYAEALRATSRTEEAITHLASVLEATDWEEPVVLRELFVCLWQEKRYDAIKRLLKRARRKGDLADSFVVAHAEAMFYNALASSTDEKDEGKIEKLHARARKAARRAVRVAAKADRASDVQSLGQVLAGGQEWEELLKLVVETRGKFQEPDLLVLQIKALKELDRIDEAIAVLEAQKRAEGVHPYLLGEMARLYMKAGKPESAAQYFERMLLKASRSIPLRLELAYLYLTMDVPRKGLAVLIPLKQLPAQGHLLMAHLYRRLDRTERAYEALQSAAKEARKAEDSDFFGADFHMFSAAVCEDLGKSDEAIAHAREARKQVPEDPMVANFLGYVLADHDRDLPEAETLIEQALAAEPENVAYLDSLAWVYYRQERFHEALKAINRTLQLGREEADAVILDHAGDIYAANGLFMLARHFWLTAIAQGALEPDAIQSKIDRSGESVPENEVHDP